MVQSMLYKAKGYSYTHTPLPRSPPPLPVSQRIHDIGFKVTIPKTPSKVRGTWSQQNLSDVIGNAAKDNVKKVHKSAMCQYTHYSFGSTDNFETNYKKNPTTSALDCSSKRS